MVRLVSTREVALYFGFGDQLVVNFEPCKLELFYQLFIGHFCHLMPFKC